MIDTNAKSVELHQHIFEDVDATQNSRELPSAENAKPVGILYFLHKIPASTCLSRACECRLFSPLIDLAVARGWRTLLAETANFALSYHFHRYDFPA